MNRFRSPIPAACGVALTALLSCAPFTLADEQTDFFEKKIRPVFIEHCSKCHGEKKSENGLRVDSLEALTKGGDIGPAIVPGDPEKSLLILAIKYEKEDLEMPPKGKLDDAIIANLEKWVKDGAHWPASAKPQTTDNKKAPRNQWALPRADKRTLHRRSLVALTGLPRTLVEIDTYLKDESSAAFEKVIDRLLASPEYGRRSGRH